MQIKVGALLEYVSVLLVITCELWLAKQQVKELSFAFPNLACEKSCSWKQRKTTFRGFGASRKCLHHCSRDLWKTHQAKHRSPADIDIDLQSVDHVSKEPPTGMSLGDLVTFHLRFSSQSSRMAHPPALVEAVKNFLQTAGRPLQVGHLPTRCRNCWSNSEVTRRTVSGMQDRLNSLPELQRRLEALEGHRQPPVQPPLQAAKSPQMFSPAGGKLDQSRLDILQSLAGRGPTT